MPANKPPAQLSADLVDVHILEMLVHIEALLRSARVIQRYVLVVRGVDGLPHGEDDGDPAERVRQRLARMLEECDAARSAVEGTLPHAAGLAVVPGREHGRSTV